VKRSRCDRRSSHITSGSELSHCATSSRAPDSRPDGPFPVKGWGLGRWRPARPSTTKTPHALCPDAGPTSYADHHALHAADCCGSGRMGP
jgi:hypothetical protein